MFGGVYGGYSGYVNWKQQIGTKGQAQFMKPVEKNSQIRAIKKAYPQYAHLELSHDYGTYGNNRYYVSFMTLEDHRLGPNSFHKTYGFKTNEGPFHAPNPNYDNWWDIIRRFLGVY